VADLPGSNGALALLEARHVDNLVETLKNVNVAVRELTRSIERFTLKIETNNKMFDEAMPLLRKIAKKGVKVG
jgi:hypothetical protein